MCWDNHASNLSRTWHVVCTYYLLYETRRTTNRVFIVHRKRKETKNTSSTPRPKNNHTRNLGSRTVSEVNKNTLACKDQGLFVVLSNVVPATTYECSNTDRHEPIQKWSERIIMKSSRTRSSITIILWKMKCVYVYVREECSAPMEAAAGTHKYLYDECGP